MGPAENKPSLCDALVNECTQLKIPSRVEWIDYAVLFLTQRAVAIGAINDEQLSHVTMALTEAVANAIIHGNLEIDSALKDSESNLFAKILSERCADPHYEQRITTIDTLYDCEKITWTIRDQGKGFAFEKALENLNNDDPDLMALSGRGMLMMKAFVDEAIWSENGTRVDLTVFRHDADRREYLRQSMSQSTRVIPLNADGGVDWEVAYDALAVNISQGGIGLLLPKLNTAKRLLIEMEVDGKKIYLPADVRNLQSINQDEHTVQIGCQFFSPQEPSLKEFKNDSSAIDHFINQLKTDEQSRSQSIQRHYKRVLFTETVSIITTPGEPSRPAIGRDLSKGGLAFICNFKLSCGDCVEVVLNKEETKPIQIKAEVRRCIHVTGQFYDVGVQFV